MGGRAGQALAVLGTWEYKMAGQALPYGIGRQEWLPYLMQVVL